MNYLIGLGSNLGDRRANLEAAVTRLAALGQLVAVASLWQTAPMYLTDQPPFLNTVVQLDSPLDPDTLMGRLLEIESALGRVREVRFGPRTLDLDIVAAEDLVFRSPNVEIPHPRLEERAFVVLPMIEIAGDWRNPATGRTLRSLPIDAAGSVRLGEPLRTPEST